MWSESAFPLGKVVEHRKEFITIDDGERYKRCRVQLHARGIVQRDEVEGAAIKTKSQQACKAGEFLVAEIDAKVGGFGIVPPDLDGAIVSGHYFLYTIKPSLLHREFLGYYVKTQRFRDQVASKGTTNYAAIRPHHVLDYTIPLPPIDEQRRIVAKIESLATKIDEAKQLRQAIQANMDLLLVAMAHRTDLSDEEKTAQGWQRTALDEVLTKFSDPVAVEPGGEYPHFGIYSFAKGLFKKAPLLGDEIKATKLYRVHEGLFIYGRLNAYEGAFAVVDADYDGCHVSNEFPAFECDKHRILPEFLLAYFSTPAVWEALRRKVTGIGGGAGNRRIRLKESILLSDHIWLPPMAWQRKIKSIAEKLAASKTDWDLVGLELDALLPAILNRAFKGEL